MMFARPLFESVTGRVTLNIVLTTCLVLELSVLSALNPSTSVVELDERSRGVSIGSNLTMWARGTGLSYRGPVD